MATDLYRIYDEKTRLLYVGISDNALYRTQTHSIQAPWWFMADTWSIESLETRDAAEWAEFEAVRDEGPLYNINYNEWFKGSAGDARQAAPAHLVRKPVAWEPRSRGPVPPPYRIRRWRWGGRIERLLFPEVQITAGMLISAYPHLAEEAEGVPAPWGSHAVVARAVLTSLVSLDEVTGASAVGDACKDFIVFSSAMSMGLLKHDEVYGTNEEPTA
jgi:hypothetical protein